MSRCSVYVFQLCEEHFTNSFSEPVGKTLLTDSVAENLLKPPMTISGRHILNTLMPPCLVFVKSDDVGAGPVCLCHYIAEYRKNIPARFRE